MATKKPHPDSVIKEPETKPEPLVPAVPDAPKKTKRICAHCGSPLE